MRTEWHVALGVCLVMIPLTLSCRRPVSATFPSTAAKPLAQTTATQEATGIHVNVTYNAGPEKVKSLRIEKVQILTYKDGGVTASLNAKPTATFDHPGPFPIKVPLTSLTQGSYFGLPIQKVRSGEHLSVRVEVKAEYHDGVFHTVDQEVPVFDAKRRL
jgi:hypothetical protein